MAYKKYLGKKREQSNFWGIKNKTLKGFKQYVMGTDPAMGQDYSAIVVFKVDNNGAEVVYSEKKVLPIEEYNKWVKEIEEHFNISDNFKKDL